VLLSYLVTSRSRRRLLRLLWAGGATGSVSELARKAGVSFASAHRELGAMRAEGLARSERVGASLVYRARRDYGRASLVRQLVGGGAARSPSPPDERVRGWLAAAGAPLLVSRRAKLPAPALEELLAEALALSHREAAVARVLPLVLWMHRDHLDHDRLLRAAVARDEGPALGFLLELAGRLGGDPRLASLSRRLRDRRRARARPYFVRAQGRRARALARRKTPALARRWGYLMNMDLDSFASAFAKHRTAT
jgi:DNA-binding transcriptional ArsR family regulator